LALTYGVWPLPDGAGRPAPAAKRSAVRQQIGRSVGPPTLAPREAEDDSDGNRGAQLFALMLPPDASPHPRADGTNGHSSNGALSAAGALSPSLRPHVPSQDTQACARTHPRTLPSRQCAYLQSRVRIHTPPDHPKAVQALHNLIY
jgi:hypothetical protein